MALGLLSSTILLDCIGLVWVTKSQTGCGGGFCSGHRMHTELNKCRVCWNNSHFIWEICEILLVKSVPDFNVLMRNGVPKIGVDPGWYIGFGQHKHHWMPNYSSNIDIDE